MNNYKDLNDYEIMYMISENDEDATNLLFTKYKPLIIKMAKEYYNKSGNCGLELDDFIQEGYCALFSAIKQYNVNKKNLFYTYVIVCIKRKMHNLIVRNANYKNMALNDSVSLYHNVNDTSLSLIDIIDDKKALKPDVEVVNLEFENAIKKMLYDLDFNDSIICELKLNGFTNKDIVALLDIGYGSLNRPLSYLKKNLSILIEKNSL